MQPAIRIQSLTVKAGRDTILTDVSFEVEAGQVIGLLGPSGAGKTTLMRVIVGLKSAASGRVEVLGLPAGSGALRRDIGYATQSLAVYPDLTVHENLSYFAVMAGAPSGRVGRVIQAVSLQDQAGRLVSGLSGGQRARVSLAVALLSKPRLLVLDEPTVGLDPLLRTQLWEQFHELAKQGTTLLISSHVMDEAERCDNLLLMRDGRVIAQGAPSVIKHQAGRRSVEEAFIAIVAGGPS